MAAQRQKPAELLQGKGSRFRGGQSIALAPTAAPGARKVPTMPTKLQPGARRAWRDYWASSVSQAVDVQADGASIRRWAHCLSERERLSAQIEESPIVAGSMGQPVLNPLARLVGQLTREIQRLEEHFGMTPLSRMRLGLAIVETKKGVLDLNRALDAEGDDVLLASVVGGGR